MENNPLEYSSDGDFDVCWRMQNPLSDTWKKVEQCKLGDGVVTMIAFSHCSVCVCIGCELSCASVGCCLSVKFRPNRWFVCRVISTTCQHFPSQICQNKSRLRHLFSFHPTCFALFSIFSIMFIYKRVAIHLRCEAFFCDFFRLCVILFCMCSFSKVNVKLEIFFPFSFAALSVPSAVTDPDDEDEDEFDDSDESAEADDDSRIYKNPRNSPSSDCPRDEEQATLLGQKCLRKCSSHEDCKSKKKKCLCDGACGMSCIKPGSSVESKKYDFISGSWAIVFNLFNEIISDRECPELPQPELGSVNMTAREFGGTAIYTCPIGYNVIGVNFSASDFLIWLNFKYLLEFNSFQLSTRLCRNGQWTGTQPICSKNSNSSSMK